MAVPVSLIFRAADVVFTVGSVEDLEAWKAAYGKDQV
jgi:hypothetical protein